MSAPALARTFARLRLTLNLLVVALTAFVVVREAPPIDDRAILSIALALVFLGTYAAGAIALRGSAGGRGGLVGAWLALLTIESLALGYLSPDAAYLVFPLFFLYLHLIPGWWGVATVAACTILAILISGLAGRMTSGGVIGPSVAAAVAIALGLGYRALYRENLERQRLIDELLATREELFEREREAGVLSERARLGREIHDTVAQGLASIHLLLHAAERADGERPGIEHVRLARETALLNLEEARRFIRALTPPALEDQTLVSALERLAGSIQRASASGAGVEVVVRVVGTAMPLPMSIETALLRIAQGALANVMQHAGASRVMMTLTYMEDAVNLDIVDNGSGFDPDAALAEAWKHGGHSFGLAAMRERVARLGGEFSLESSPGAGTAVAVTFGFET
ncbi:MAG: sensor histidine kinase [Thermomicrobiales bacterium]|nr:sensor histidine kinase [Thermomicrobiales bacterium]